MWWLMGCLFAGQPRVVEVGEVRYTPVLTGLERVTELVVTAEASVVAQQHGVVSVVRDGKAAPWLDLRTLEDGRVVRDGGERGLLGMAVDPDDPGRWVLSWTATKGKQLLSTLATFRTDPAVPVGAAPLQLEHVLFQTPQPYSNHNGGCVRFLPDGTLLLGLGDGGSAGDPLGSGQDRSTPLGAFLRFDPDLPAPHIPPDNPFAGVAGTHPALWATGARNPWRFVVGEDGLVIAGDVGQNRFEEITRVPRGGNLGWKIREGHSCFEADTCAEGFEEPLFVYGRDLGQSVTGGVFGKHGRFRDRYVFADFLSGRVWSMKVPETGPATDVVDHGETGFRISTFALDAEGRVLVVDYMGAVYRMEAVP